MDHQRPNLYDYPGEVVFDGEVYCRTRATLLELFRAGVPYIRTVKLRDDPEDDPEEEEPEEKGPCHIIFDEAVYQKSDIDPALIDDIVPRVTKVKAAAPQPHIPSITQAVAAAGFQVGQTTDLPYGFDLPESQRSQHFTIPNRNDAPSAHLLGRRNKWDPTHRAYLFQLLETAVTMLNRPIRAKDFRPITEALHRRFRNTGIPPNIYPERGYNTVHSYVVKTCSADLQAIAARVLQAGSGGGGGGIGAQQQG